MILKILNKWLPVILWMAVIFALSSVTSRQVSGFSLVDFLFKKGAHLTEYAILYILLLRATSKNWMLCAFVVLSFALSDEWHQSFTPGREPTIRDVGFDLVGAFWGGYLIWKLSPKIVRKLPAWVRI